jgi:ABC-type Fe3+-siderophore transport system permease subunit
MEMEKGLELLFDYTKFHIGVYLTLAAVYITLITSKVGGKLPKLQPQFAWIALLFIITSGFAGGVIASSITQCGCSKVAEFLNQDIGPWSTHPFSGRTWTYIEHTSFWIGIVFIVLSFWKSR